jgi:transposase
MAGDCADARIAQGAFSLLVIVNTDCSRKEASGRSLVAYCIPSHVELFVKQEKSDAADAEAICEAAQRATIWFVADGEGALAEAK